MECRSSGRKSRVCPPHSYRTFSGGQAYVETDPLEADRASIIRNFIAGEYDRPIGVLACNPIEGWARDVSESIAHEIARTDADLTAGTRAFVVNC
jgi:hypothetical protein